jgi:phage FluMu protein Com
MGKQNRKRQEKQERRKLDAQSDAEEKSGCGDKEIQKPKIKNLVAIHECLEKTFCGIKFELQPSAVQDGRECPGCGGKQTKFVGIREASTTFSSIPERLKHKGPPASSQSLGSASDRNVVNCGFCGYVFTIREEADWADVACPKCRQMGRISFANSQNIEDYPDT